MEINRSTFILNTHLSMSIEQNKKTYSLQELLKGIRDETFNAEKTYQILKENLFLLKEVDFDSITVFWSVICEKAKDENCKFDEWSDIAPKIFALDPTLDLTVRPIFNPRNDNIFTQVLYGNINSRLQLLKYFLFADVPDSILDNITSSYKTEINKIQSEIDFVFERALEIFKQRHAAGSFFNYLPSEICNHIALDIISTEFPFFNPEFLKQRILAYSIKKYGAASIL